MDFSSSPLDPAEGLVFLNYLWQIFRPLFGYVIGAGLFMSAMLALRAFLWGKD